MHFIYSVAQMSSVDMKTLILPTNLKIALQHHKQQLLLTSGVRAG
jgi:hypothetical protein